MVEWVWSNPAVMIGFFLFKNRVSNLRYEDSILNRESDLLSKKKRTISRVRKERIGA
jgi:hypothetical protein